MSTLLTRMRPLAARTSRIRLLHRTRRVTLSGTATLPATEERLATEAEIARLRSMVAVRSA